MKDVGKVGKVWLRTQETEWLDSEWHDEIREKIEERVAASEMFGNTWTDYLGFFAPFGTKNSFWNRLQNSPMLRHFFVHNKDFGKELGKMKLSANGPDLKVTAPDVDAAVNNCALICALLLGIPFGVISNLSEENLKSMMIAAPQIHCSDSLNYSDLTNSDYSESCISDFKDKFTFMYQMCMACFYSSCYTLITAVLYYMCRPAESYNNSSVVTLMKAFTLEIRREMRQEMRSGGEELPSTPFENRMLELEVFEKAKFMAMNEAEEQKSQEFYIWYQSQSTSFLFPVLHSDAWCRGEIFCNRHFFWLAVRAHHLILLVESVHAKLLECDSAVYTTVSKNSVPVHQRNREKRFHYFILIRRNCGIHFLLHLRVMLATPTQLF
jgi:hypothetical protein